jgi:hypothetical protein
VSALAERVEEHLRAIDDARELVEALAWLDRGCRFNAGYLRRFCYLHARDQGAWIASERDALVGEMASWAGCDPAALRFDVERVKAERDQASECAHLERITGMRDEPEPAEPEGDERQP